MHPTRRQLPALLLALGLSSWVGAQTATAVTTPSAHPPERPRAAAVPSPRPALITGEISTRRFRLLYTARSEGVARSLARDIERARSEFVEHFGRDWPGVTEVRIGMGRSELEALGLAGAPPPSWAKALAYPEHDIVLMEAGSLTEAEGPGLLRHELAHVALGKLGGAAWPHWFQEGMAEQLSPGRFDARHYLAIYRAVKQDRMFDFDDLARAWPSHPTEVELAYAQSSSFVAFLSERHGPARFGELIDAVSSGLPFETAFARAFRTSLRLEEGAWRTRLPDRYSWLPVALMSSMLWLGASVLCVVAFVRRRRAVVRHRAEQEAEEAAFDAAQRILEAEGRAARPEEEPVSGAEPGEGMESEETEGETDGKVKPTVH